MAQRIIIERIAPEGPNLSYSLHPASDTMIALDNGWRIVTVSTAIVASHLISTFVLEKEEPKPVQRITARDL